MKRNKNLTSDFFNYEDKNFLKNGKKYKYFLIPGLFTDNFGVKYMKDIINLFKELDLFLIKIPLNTGGTVNENTNYIKDYIMKEGLPKKEIIIIAHSKGGVDAATSIAKYNLYDYIKTIILIQTPWKGSFIVEKIISNPILYNINSFLTNIVKADEESFLDLTYENREKSIKKYKFDVNKVKTICLYSIKEYRLFDILIDNFDNDGFIRKEEAVIPGSYYVELKNIDHSEIAFNNNKICSKKIIYSLLLLSLKD
jgi:hypothetical protein